ncbi:hypothetical protein HK100_001103, partial [Physocladia obscura]
MDFETQVPDSVPETIMAPIEPKTTLQQGPNVKLTALEFRVVIVSLVLALFLGALDQGVYAVAVPAIAA